jgi:Protein of unknown function (DUF2971)
VDKSSIHLACAAGLLQPSYMNVTDEDFRAHQIFQPYAFDRQKPLFLNENARFVHYTGAEAALNMFRTKEIWMRNATCMNDYMEIQYGLECLAAAYNGQFGDELKKYIDDLHSGLSDEIEKLFNGWSPSFARQTFMFCISEHNADEDSIGRLSMWRAYGAGAAIALVLKARPFVQPTDALRSYTTPVAYMSKEAFSDEFRRLVDNVKSNEDFVRQLKRSDLKSCIFNAFRFAALSTKHPGFREEKEWRVVFMRDFEQALDPQLEAANRLNKEIVAIHGTPQVIYKIPLRNVPDEGLEGIEVAELLDRVIIGPTEYPAAAREAIVDLLEKEIPDAASKVVVSDIPVR